MFGITVNAHSAVPLYKQIALQIKQSIAGSQVKPGERIPTVRKLALDLNF